MAFVSQPNRWVVQVGAATTTLTYALQVKPAPLTVTPDGSDPVSGSVEFVITNQTSAAVTISNIDFVLQIGKASSDLTASTANIATAASDDMNWSIQKPGNVTHGPATYRVEPNTTTSYPLAVGASLTVQFYNFTTAAEPGTSTIEIWETTISAQPPSHNPKHHTGSSSFQVTTFPAGFYFNGLTATVLSGSEPIPVAQVMRSSCITLLWNSSVVDVASYEVFYTDPVHGQQSATPSKFGEWLSPPLAVDTVFTLVVTTSGEGGVVLSAALSVAVTVQNADLVVQSVTAGTVAVSGTLSVQGAISTASTITSKGAIFGLGMAPRGGIILYYGDLHDRSQWTVAGTGVAGTQYAGWQLCNGEQGSPDLRDKFVPGAGGSYQVGATGGEDRVKLSIEEIPAHDHGSFTLGNDPSLLLPGFAWESASGPKPGIVVSTGIPGTPSESTIEVSWHKHGITHEGGSQDHENRPPFFALAYLMKVV